jgi:hypothetical protein
MTSQPLIVHNPNRCYILGESCNKSIMEKPKLKQFGDLSREDFEQHPVWIGCHTVDYDQPWYDDTDEETFRPWAADLPVDGSEAMLLVRSTVELRDGSTHLGFVTPAPTPGDLGTQQPHIFVGSDRAFGFWGGIIGVPVEERQALYTMLGKHPDAVFPLRFTGDPALATGEIVGEVLGFYKYSIGNSRVEIEV